jgi:imidazole glycerol-phosphate synthase subunit HisF
MITKKNRLVAIIFFKDGNVVQSKLFKQHKVVGDPYVIIDRLSAWNADEVIYLNIRPELSNFNRQDKNIKYHSDFDKIIQFVGTKAFMPLTVGGGIKNLSDVERYFKMGADKVSINSEIFKNPKLVYECSKIYGSQSIVASIDIKKDVDNNEYRAFIDSGKTKIIFSLTDYIKKIEDQGAGELLINNIDRDGMGNGYDLDLLKLIKETTKLPIIFSGGVGKFEHLSEGIEHDLKAVAAGNIFHFTENSYFEAIKFLYENNCNTRMPKINFI